jgi:apolipoprotein N-acyltransferase
VPVPGAHPFPGHGWLSRLVVAILIGWALRYVVGLEPVWWLAWLAPAPLLVLAFRSPSVAAAGGLTLLAALVGTSVNLPYYRLVMPLPAAIAATLGQALLWVLVVLSTRRVVLRFEAWWTMAAYPVFWVAVDMLMAALLPDGNWGSLAYSQAELLPLLQLTSLFGTAGVLFVLVLAPSAIALGCTFGRKLEHGSLAFAVLLAVFWAVAAYGQYRLRKPATGSLATVGLASIDDVIHAGSGPGEIARIWTRYDELVTSLAARGARLVVLPEKIALLGSRDALAVQRRLGALAARNKVWIDAGVGLADGGGKRNVSWRFDPSGVLVQAYQKQRLAPVEKGFVAGSEYKLNPIGGATYGMAICKDMHFAALGREYARLQAGVMVVPAWDFGVDGWMAARMTLIRGIEGGYTVVRVAREGLMTASDRYGRVVAEQRSSGMPGSSMLVSVAAGAPMATLYRQIGDLFGWVCVGIAVVFSCLGRGKWARPRSAEVAAVTSGVQQTSG